MEVIAAGFDSAHGQNHALLRTVGYLDKHRDMFSFLEFVRHCHFGCLFSRHEAFGISNREFIRAGVPVLTWDIGGLADTVPDGMGHVFPACVAADTIADTLEDYLRHPDDYYSLRVLTNKRAEEAGWARTVSNLQAIWRGAKEFRYKMKVA